MSKPPKIVIPGLNRGIGVPPGYVLGRMPGTGKGPAQLLNMGSLRKLGVAGASGVAQSTSTAISTAHSENISLKTSVSTSLSQISSSLSGAVSSTGSLSTAVSTVISGSISVVNSRVDSLSTAVGGGGGVDDDAALSTSLSSAVSVNTTQSTSLSLLSSSLSGAISSTSSLSSAVSTVDSNQSTSLSQISSSLSAEISTDLSRINSLSTAVGGGGGSGWTAVSSVTASGGSVAFTGLGGYTELLMIAMDTVTGSAAFRQIHASTDGGSTYYTTAGDYKTIGASGAATNIGELAGQSASQTTASLMVHIFGNIAGKAKVFQSVNQGIGCFTNNVGMTTNVIDALRITANGQTFSAGTITVWGR